MRVALPMLDGAFCPHFGRADSVMLCEVNLAQRKLDRPRVIDRMAHGCESLPGWLADLAVQTVVAGGIGAGARQALADRGIAVSAGHEGDSPEAVLDQFFANPAGTEGVTCGDHDHEHHHCRH